MRYVTLGYLVPRRLQWDTMRYNDVWVHEVGWENNSLNRGFDMPANWTYLPIELVDAAKYLHPGPKEG